MGPKNWIPKYLGLKIFLVKTNFGPKMAPKKLGQNWVRNNWAIHDMEKSCQDRCCLDQCHRDSWHLLKMVPGTFKVWSNRVSNSWDIPDRDKCLNPLRLGWGFHKNKPFWCIFSFAGSENLSCYKSKWSFALFIFSTVIVNVVFCPFSASGD